MAECCILVSPAVYTSSSPTPSSTKIASKLGQHQCSARSSAPGERTTQRRNDARLSTFHTSAPALQERHLPSPQRTNIAVRAAQSVDITTTTSAAELVAQIEPITTTAIMTTATGTAITANPPHQRRSHNANSSRRSNTTQSGRPPFNQMAQTNL